MPVRRLSAQIQIVLIVLAMGCGSQAGRATPDGLVEATAAQATASLPPRLTIDRLVNPATRVQPNGRVVQFSLHALIHFNDLTELFAYIDKQAGRWQFETPGDRQAFGNDLLQRGVESRIVSMQTELPLEVVLTHTRAELEQAVARIRTPDTPLVFKGVNWQLPATTYRDAFLRVRERWKVSLNCWSASSSLPGRVLSNWFLIDEGIQLFGATYDSTEHFWQAVKFHPDVTVADLHALLADFSSADWAPWLGALERDQRFYFANAYAVEFLKNNLQRERLTWFEAELTKSARPVEHARAAQQRTGRQPGDPIRFPAVEEKVLWGDLADIFHLVVAFSNRPGMALSGDVGRVRDALVKHSFDAIYLPGYAGGRFPFLSQQYRDLMLEIWKVKYLQMPRFGEVIRSTAGMKLDHFLDDGDSPDIPIPVYVGQLNRIRELALAQSTAR